MSRISYLTIGLSLLCVCPLFGQDTSAVAIQQGQEPPQAKDADRVRSAVTAPQAVYTPDPEYTTAARKQGVEGVVGLQLTVTAEGRTEDLTVIKSLDPGLDENAVKAVRRWKFRPATKDGHPVAAQIKVTVAFNLYHKQ